jgi:hypothetical protein
MTELIDTIRSRGSWEIIIRPGRYAEERLTNVTELHEIVQRASVQMGGWDIPPVDSPTQARIGDRYVDQEIDWSNFLEFWRLTQSGQFFHLVGIYSDWRDRSVWGVPEAGWQPGRELSVSEVLFRVTGAFELAARLSLTNAGDDPMHIDVGVKGIANRILAIDTGKRAPFTRVRRANIAEYARAFSFERDQLTTDPRGLALTAALELFRRFDWDPSVELLRELQSEACRMV